MLWLKILPVIHTNVHSSNFNTSHVVVKAFAAGTYPVEFTHFNTSHVVVKDTFDRAENEGIYNFNTSHVVVKAKHNST